MKYVLLVVAAAIGIYVAIAARRGHDDDPFAQPWGDA